MPAENEYSLQDLADLTEVTPRTIRYYVAQGLLSSPEGAGPGTRYSEGHLVRLRLIRQLQREHLPLAEIRARIGGLDDEAITELLEAPTAAGVNESAVDYIRAVLGGGVAPGQMQAPAPTPEPSFLRRMALPDMRADASTPPPSAPGPGTPDAPATATPSIPDRSQWDRISLAPDIELHIRRPLSRLQNKRVDRLLAIARQLLEEDQS